MEITAGELANLLNGKVVGDKDVSVNRPARIEDGEPGTLTFLANPRYEPYAYTTGSSIILVSKEFEPTRDISAVMIRVNNVYEAMSLLAEKFEVGRSRPTGISKDARIHPEAEIGEGVSVAEFVVVRKGAKIGTGTILHPFVMVGEKVTIGDRCEMHSGVKIEHSCVIGNDVIVHANTVIGSDGFGFAPTDDGYKKINQLGNVVIEDRVEIGANVVIDRASLGSTLICEGTKLDNLIQIAHNVRIGKHTVIAAQAGVAGSTKVGDRVMIGGQVGIIGHLNIADGSQIQAQSGVTNSTKEGDQLWGSPAMNFKKFLRVYAAFKNLNHTVDDLKEIKRTIKDLENKLEQLQSDS